MSKSHSPDSESGRADSTSVRAILSPIVEPLLDRIRATEPEGRTRLIAIDGRGGSGKSELARALVDADPSLKILQIDHFPCRAEEHPFHPLGIQARISEARLTMALLPLIAGDPAPVWRSPWRDPCRGRSASGPSSPKRQGVDVPYHVRGGGTVLVEGCYALLPSLRSLYDLAIWMECERDVALARAHRRDGSGSGVLDVWEQVHVPNQERYIATHRPQEWAQVLVDVTATGQARLLRI